MKAKAILLTILSILPLCSCDTRSGLDKQIDMVNRQCGFMLNSKLEDFPPSWQGEFRGTLEHFEFKKTRQDGIDVYTCGTWDYLTTEFYYRDGLEVGFKTRDPQFYFSIFGRTIGSPIYSFEGANYKDLTTVLIERSYDPVIKKNA